ncbi:uncharacterized protein BJX67DRAFT_320430 [Aspergillus lucknowensis]|uniref:Secreted protein n=1 Tax=Aspergillus lucknowensis TaxID=176173 RepID=A0ABR4M2E1_9EURO
MRKTTVWLATRVWLLASSLIDRFCDGGDAGFSEVCNRSMPEHGRCNEGKKGVRHSACERDKQLAAPDGGGWWLYPTGGLCCRRTVLGRGALEFCQDVYWNRSSDMYMNS